MMEKIRLMWCSDFMQAPTGYGTVTKNILTRLQKTGRYEIYHQAFQYIGQSIDIDGIHVLPMNKECNPPNIAKDVLAMHIDKYKPDVVVFLCDSFFVTYLADPNYSLGKAKTMFYMPIDGEPVPFGCEGVFRRMDKIIAMSKFGRDIIKRDLNIDCEVIYHGYDKENYKPMDKAEIKKKLNLQDKFVIGVVGRNQGRKVHSELFKAFKKFLERNPDAILYMHCDPMDPQGINLLAFAQFLKIDKSVFFTKMPGFGYGVETSKLNEIYNLFDIHTLTTTGEGFGIPILESMACGIPNALPDYTTSRELIEGRGELARIATLITGTYFVERGMVDKDDIVEKWQKLKDNPGLREEYSKKCIEFARQYDWDSLIPLWESAIKSVLTHARGDFV